MKKFKTADFWISTVLIAGFLAASLIRMDNTFIIGYFVVGAWQCASMLVHKANACFINRNGERYAYHRFVMGIIITVSILGGIAFFFEAAAALLLFVLVLLLIGAPFMAVWYTILCYNEVFIKMQRPLAILK